MESFNFLVNFYVLSKRAFVRENNTFFLDKLNLFAYKM